jgi:hypothetical protein
MANKFFLHSKEESTMVSTWENALFCSILKNGTMSLRLRIYCDDEGCGTAWLGAIRNIRTPKQFIEAFESISEISNWDINETLPELHKHHPIFASSLKQEIKAGSTPFPRTVIKRLITVNHSSQLVDAYEDCESVQCSQIYPLWLYPSCDKSFGSSAPV